MENDLQELMFEMWGNLLQNECDPSKKLTALIALLQVYSAILGMPEDEFKDLSHSVGISYPGPTSDEYGEWIIKYYARR